MSFLKITDPKKRDLMVAEFLKTKKNIQRNQLVERLGEQHAMAGFTRQYNLNRLQTFRKIYHKIF